jgi:hypothetical protein
MTEPQPFPKTGRLADNMNLDLKTLRTILQRETGLVYGYVVASIDYKRGTFVQTGCGPNFQGDLITLSTCKHLMRSRLELADWPGVWIAGFTGVNQVPGERLNYLFYVMRVADAYPSHRDLWYKLPDTVRQAKAARLNPLGDLYQPHKSGGDPFDPGTYEPPCSDHSHFPKNGWHKDIHYEGYGGRPPLLLVGDRQFSFLWDRPVIAYPPPMHPRTKNHNLSNLLKRLK